MFGMHIPQTGGQGPRLPLDSPSSNHKAPPLSKHITVKTFKTSTDGHSVLSPARVPASFPRYRVGKLIEKSESRIG